MDEDDSPDELINRSTSNSKGKKPASWAISDDSDDGAEESEEGESDSGDEEEDDHLDEELNGEDDDEEEDDDAKAEEGAFGETSACLDGMSSDEDSEKCPICLNSFSSQPVATPENCEHYFCFDCILEWAKNANSCPVDRLAFNSIYLRKCYGGKVQKMITVQKKAKKEQEEVIDVDLEQTNCEVCGGSDREDRLLLCDGCDAGYHMECLTPPLDAVPVEEWFCPECVANNRHLRDSGEDRHVDSVPSSAQPAASHSQSRAAGLTRAIARTQQSERVRANVNRHRITQARSSQLAPTYLIQSTWLDDTINAVVAGLNTAVYVRDFTSHVPARRRRKTRKRRSRKTTSVAKKGSSGATKVRRRRRKVRRTKAKGNVVGKKAATPRSRIASSLGIAKDKKSSSLPTVYRPSEHTLSSMRADIGAASLSIYGDPSDLDPFVDREEGGQQDHITSLLEAKRRGISRSALRSHQPVARPVTASISRRGADISQSGGVVQPAPMPDLLGSILSGQSMLLMDSSDVIINRDGSLKAAKPVSLSSAATAGGSSSGPGDSGAHITTNLDVPGTSQSPSLSPLFTPPSASHPQPLHHSDFAPRGHLSLQPTCTTKSPGLWATNGVGAPSSTAQTPNLISKVPSQSQTKKAPTKPMWVDVSVLPRIPKIKRDSSSVVNGAGGGGGDSDKNRRGNSSPCTSSSNRNGMPETGMTSLAGEKNSQQSVDQQQGRTSRQAHRPRPDGAGSSSAFSNSFSSSSLYAGSPSTQTCHSSSSSAVSFRINSSGNSWQSRRLSVTSTTSAGEGSVQGRWREKADEARKRQLHRDKQMLLASRTSISKEEDTSNIYDPFNPTLSDSSSSDGEAENTSDASRQASRAASGGNKQGGVQIKQEPVQVKSEKEERAVSQEEPACPQETVQQTVRCTVKVEKDTQVVKASTGIKVKREPGLDDADETDRCPQVKGCLTSDIPSPALHRSLKLETETHMEVSGQSFGPPSTGLPNQQKDPSTSGSASNQIKVKTEIRSDLTSPPRDSKTPAKKDVSCKQPHSNSSEADRGRRGQHHASGQGDRRQRDKERDTRSRERRRTHSISDSSQCESPERKRHRPRSQSKDMRRSRSVSSSSSREDPRKKKPERRSHDRSGGRERNREERMTSKDQRNRRSRSKSRSTSRSRERRTNPSQTQQSSVSNRETESRSKDNKRHRSSSRERRKQEAVSKRSQKTSGSSSSKDKRERRKEKDTTESPLKDGNKGNRQHGSSSSSDSKVKKEDEDVGSDRHSTSAESLKEIKVEKEIKKEEETVDICEYLPLAKVIKREDTDHHFLSENVKEEDIRTDPVKKESCEIIKTERGETIKCEPTSSEVCALPPGASFPPLTTPDVADAQSHPDLNAPLQPAHSGRSSVPVKQEPQPSDSDDDFNVDLMLDNLDNTKCERAEGSGVTVKQEKDGPEVKSEGEQVSAVCGAKTKTQGKRVTWNIQEPDRPDADKSASKLALYKLKLKQEGARRPSTIQTPVENAAGAGSVSNPSTTDGPIHSSSTSDHVHMQRMSTSGQAKAQEGDLSRKDKYLKKLHMQERAIEEVKLAIKPFYQRRDINKEEYKEILRKAVEKVCHSKSGEINPVKVGNLVKAYVDKYKHARKQKGSV